MNKSHEDHKNKFEQLYNRYKKLMFYIAQKILLKDELVQEAVQDALKKIYINIDHVNDIGCRKTHNWVVCIVKREAINKLKYEKRRQHDSDEIFEYVDFNHNFVDDTAIINIEVEEILKALEQITEYCDVIIYKYYFGYSDEMLAKHYNISVANVRKRCERCRQRLKRFLLSEGVKDE